MSNQAADNAPTIPNVTVVLSDVLNRWVIGRRDWPECMPSGLNEGAGWWISKQERIVKSERPKLKQKRADKNNVQPGYYWDVPYIDRLAYTLELFLRLPVKSQCVINDAVDKGIHWRGDGMNFFLLNDVSVIGEMMKIKKTGLVVYQKEASKILSGFVK